LPCIWLCKRVLARVEALGGSWVDFYLAVNPLKFPLPPHEVCSQGVKKTADICPLATLSKLHTKRTFVFNTRRNKKSARAFQRPVEFAAWGRGSRSPHPRSPITTTLTFEFAARTPMTTTLTYSCTLLQHTTPTNYSEIHACMESLPGSPSRQLCDQHLKFR
jgi:hypothetical protein